MGIEIGLCTCSIWLEGHTGDCQHNVLFLGPCYNTGPNLGGPRNDHNFDNPPYTLLQTTWTWAEVPKPGVCDLGLNFCAGTL